MIHARACWIWSHHVVCGPARLASDAGSLEIFFGFAMPSGIIIPPRKGDQPMANRAPQAAHSLQSSQKREEKRAPKLAPLI
jgi:hypothetical protein